LLTEYEGRLRDAASKRILVEVALLKAAQARSAVSVDTILQKLQSLRDEPSTSETSGSFSPQQLPARPAAPSHPNVPTDSHRMGQVAAEIAPRPSVPVAPTELVAIPKPQADLVELWAKLVDAAGRASPFVRTYFLEAHPVSLTKNVLTIGFDPEFGDHVG